MSKFFNSRATKFIDSFPDASLENFDCPLTKRCKFNFAYFDKQSAGQDFCDWDQKSLALLFDKLKAYSREPLEYWLTKPAGKKGTVLSIYGAFPHRSDFTNPKFVPHQALWGRFRLDWAARLCGFIVPKTMHGNVHEGTKQRFDSNTFYVVFLDQDHKFYNSEDK